MSVCPSRDAIHRAVSVPFAAGHGYSTSTPLRMDIFTALAFPRLAAAQNTLDLLSSRRAPASAVAAQTSAATSNLISIAPRRLRQAMPQSVLARPARLSVRPTERSAEAPQKIPAQRSDAIVRIVRTAVERGAKGSKAARQSLVFLLVSYTR